MMRVRFVLALFPLFLFCSGSPAVAQDIAAGVVSATIPDGERSIANWGKDLYSEDQAAQRRAVEALVAAGSAGDQTLREALLETDGKVRENLAAGLVEMGTRGVPSLLRILLLLDGGAND